MIDAGVISFETWISQKDRNWVVKAVDVAQAKGDQFAGEYRENWNSKWRSINDMICSQHFFDIKKTDSIVSRLN